ncbi:Vitellogenin-2 [Oryzias melastigma]|uniref:Vitellogenin-2 n=1 Tax=Oryzias melastigma TaxID=30732 RepID=A0A834F1D9_ORYME|nr:Vitellogenin-2 [Oryzias melastigma]
MRGLILALSLALVAPEFSPGKTYEYKYEAHLLGGLPEEGLARAGVKIESRVWISPIAPDTFIMKLVEPALYEYSGIWPTETFRPASKLTTALAAQLLTPIKFEYNNGVVGKVFAPHGISTSVLNIYRGLLNILQLNIKKTQNVYELQEPGTQGVCKTHYVISEDSKADRIHLSKTKDLSHCQERIYKDFGLAGYTERCTECEARGKTMKGAAAINYVMKPSTTGSLILEATATELIQYSPINILNGAAQMEAKQTLTFLSIKKVPVEPISADYLPRGSLKYEFGSELLQTPIELLRISNAEAQIVETLNKLVSLNMGKAHEDSPLKFIELIQLLRVTKYESIEALWDQYKARSDYRTWLLSSIPAIGNHVALKFIKEKIISGDLTSFEATEALLSSLHLVVADLESLKLVEGLAMTPEVREHPVLREISMLGFGSMVYKYCAEFPSCPVELVKPIHELIIRALDRHPWMVGAAGSAFYINDAATVLPRTVMAKARTYLAGAYVDVLEFGVRTEGIQEALLKVNDSPATDRLTKMKEAIKALSDWKAYPSSQPLASAYVKVLGQEMAFASIDKPMVEHIVQLANAVDIRAYGKKALDALLAGYTKQYSKPMLAAEVRRIFPTSVGFPMELSLYSAGVGAASLEVQASVSPPLPENINVGHLLKSDISLRAAVAPSISMHTYAVMGVNTAFLQASLMSRAKIHSVAPAKFAARLDMNKGNFNFQILPVEGVDTIASARVDTFAVARNVEDLEATKITSIIPAVNSTKLSKQNSTALRSRMASSLEDSSSASSEILFSKTLNQFASKLKIPKASMWKRCASSYTFGIKACAEMATRNASYVRNNPIYTAIGNHSFTLKSKTIDRRISKTIDLAQVLNRTSKWRSSSSSSSRSSRPSLSVRSGSSSSISSSSSSSSMSKVRYLSNTVDSLVTILIHAKRADHQHQGYQTTVYYDKENSRVQIIFANLTESDKWRICADGVMLSEHKFMTRVTWGIECKQYNASIIAETGLVGKEPAARLKMTWERLPEGLKRYAKWASEYLSRIAVRNGVSQAKVKNIQKQIQLTAAVNETSLNVTLKTPQSTLYKLGLGLPISLPLGETAAELEAYPDSWTHKLSYMLTKAHAECYMKLESVKLEKQVNHFGEDSKCYSVEPVLRCLPGCMPVKTTTVNVGYHCLPIDTNLNRNDGLSSIFQKSIDLRETAEAHLACRCTPQCA